ncbi:hypothetical protein CYMTET_50432 [Cymbomonas tetramitiformis]|uniref:Uncharacterized protein n=1 Tax=Cymbomonas tetramitiformis TaxID=36881 RepID=A0AAE0ETQ2_9CHLO|nr:hypothetical protein CYMTET_50432 [Cymbomonas tetramitiformis]
MLQAFLLQLLQLLQREEELEAAVQEVVIMPGQLPAGWEEDAKQYLGAVGITDKRLARIVICGRYFDAVKGQKCLPVMEGSMRGCLDARAGGGDRADDLGAAAPLVTPHDHQLPCREGLGGASEGKGGEEEDKGYGHLADGVVPRKRDRHR